MSKKQVNAIMKSKLSFKEKYEFVEQHPEMPVPELAKECKCSERSIRRLLRRLRKQSAPVANREYLQSVLAELSNEIEKSKAHVRSGSTPSSRLYKVQGDTVRLRQQVNSTPFRLLPCREHYMWECVVRDGVVHVSEVTQDAPTESRTSHTAAVLVRELEAVRHTRPTSAAAQFTKCKTVLALVSGILRAMSEPDVESAPVRYLWTAVIPGAEGLLQ